MGKSALAKAIGKEVLNNADVIITTAYNAWKNAGKPNLKEFAVQFAKEVGKNADYIYNGVVRVASACNEDEVEIIDAWEPGEDFDLIQLAEKVIERYPPALRKEYQQENRIRWALELALH